MPCPFAAARPFPASGKLTESMMGLERLALRVVGTAARIWDDGRYHAKLKLGMTKAPILLPYRGHLAGGRLRFGGRVVEDEGVVGAPPSYSRWTNLKRTFRRYETDEVRGARVEWSGCGLRGHAVSDKQGFFRIDVPCEMLSGDDPWARIDLVARVAPGYEFEALRSHTFVRVVSPDATFAVVSDIDDTIVETGAQTLVRHGRTVSLNSAEGRVAFPGIAFLYRALASGRRGGETNPIFYVSSSPWNLYDLFEAFLRLRDIPFGPMFLKDFGLDTTQWLSGSHRTHKIAAIERCLADCPSLPFLLIGDTGQSDAMIYAEIVRDHPGRVLAVFLRDVSPDGFRPHVHDAMRAIEAAGVPLVAGPTLREAATRAEAMGLVEPGTAERMTDEMEEDRKELEDWRWPRPFNLHRPAKPETAEAAD